MTLTTNGWQCDNCGETEPGRLPDTWEETYVPAEGGWDGTSATFCDRCSTARALLQEFDNEEIEALHHYLTASTSDYSEGQK